MAEVSSYIWSRILWKLKETKNLYKIAVKELATKTKEKKNPKFKYFINFANNTCSMFEMKEKKKERKKKEKNGCSVDNDDCHQNFEWLFREIISLQ